MAVFLQGSAGPAFGDSGGIPSNSPLLSVGDWAALALAPKRSGTDVTIRAKPAPYVGRWFDHMYAEYDDGRGQYIYRGGPRWPFLHAQVDPAAQSPDYGADGRVLFHTFLPNVAAEDAIRPAQKDAQRVNCAEPPYGFAESNSNKVMGDFTESQFGRRVGDQRTIGYRDVSAPPPPTVYPWTVPIL